MTGNNRPQKWEVWFADVQFDDGTKSKKRPVVVIDDKIAYLLCYKVTGQEPKPYRKEYELQNWQEAGLDTNSTVILDNHIKLSIDKFIHKIGKLSVKDFVAIKVKTQNFT